MHTDILNHFSKYLKIVMTEMASLGKRTKHFDIKFFYITDLIKKREKQVENCPINDCQIHYKTVGII